MTRQPTPKDLSLKWLELFQICARKGSLQAVSSETGLSVSTVSHHLRNLEDHLGVSLFNHSRRPMVLTEKGSVFLRNIDTALQSIRKAIAEASAGNVAEASLLRFGAIEDFDSDIMPELAVTMSRAMPRCDFLFKTSTSHEIIEMLRDRQLDLGVTVMPPNRLLDLQVRPILRDPFVLVLHLTNELSHSEIVSGKTKLPFLKFSSKLIIAQLIDSQLRRLGVSPSVRFECDSNQTLMAMVATGAGWTITTPLLFARAKRFHPKLSMHPFPSKDFSRTLAIVSTPDCSNSIRDVIGQNLRNLLTEYAIAPSHKKMPWLKDSFRLIEQADLDK